jgi:dCTP deaminase
LRSAGRVLSDRSLRERLSAGSIGIDSLDEAAIQPASVDLHLARAFRVFTRHRHTHVELARDQTDLTEVGVSA